MLSTSLRKTIILPIMFLMLFTIPLTISCAERTDTKSINSGEIVNLPEPALDSDYSIEQALQSRRSVRRYSDKPVDIQTVSQILWSAQGITHEQRGYKTAPSAGAIFPLEIYAAVGNVEGLSAGLYHYISDNHHLVKIHDQDIRTDLSAAALRQTSVRDGAFVVIIAAIYERTTGRYGERGIKYVHMEVGHVGQNIHLQAKSLGLGTVVIGAFIDEEMKRVLNLPEDQIPLYLMPLGHK